ncbi:MAG TPA: DUF3667 domain-containing protein, partial [Chitinophagaceae bacterium]|nr:DUF3667 domain-containing protein [Chitinophagaceae bacterium]
WHLVAHFFNDVTHFDGKFFTTLKDLLIKPGFLSKEYMIGRRASYLNPVRMYVFTSAIFFLLFFSFFQSKEPLKIGGSINGKSFADIDKMDSATFAKFTSHINEEIERPAKPMTREEFKKYADTVFKVFLDTSTAFRFTGTNYESVKQFDSLQHTNAREHNWIRRQLIYKELELNEKYHKSKVEVINAIKEAWMHSLPQMLWISLPLLALILKFMYIRRKQFYYVSHIIFSIHLYVFVFIVQLILFSISKLNKTPGLEFLSYAPLIIIPGMLVYEFLALKKFYGQRWIKTFFKFLLINISYIIMLVLLFAFFGVFSFFKI